MKSDLIPVILNPAAGAGKAGRKLELLQNGMQRLGLKYQIFVSRSESDLKRLTRQLGSQNEIIVGAGGDSTFHFMANELVQLPRPATLGIIGLGSSNDIPREFNLTTLKTALLALKKGESRPIDLGAVLVKDEVICYVFGQVNLGLGVKVNEDVASLACRWPVFQAWQTLSGLMAIIINYLKKKEMLLPLTVETRKKSYQGIFQVALLSNIRYWATGRKIVPQARPDDGQFDLFLLKPLPFFSLIKMALLSRSGKHFAANHVILDRADYFKLSSSRKFRVQADGEILKRGGQPMETDSLELKVVRRCLKIIS